MGIHRLRLEQHSNQELGNYKVWVVSSCKNVQRLTVGNIMKESYDLSYSSLLLLVTLIPLNWLIKQCQRLCHVLCISLETLVTLA